MELIFATNNENKRTEIQELLPGNIQLYKLKDVNITEDIPEEAATLEGNAIAKARYVFNATGKSCFADDTGLEIEALNNEPGVYSARYAGESKDSEANIDKVLRKLNGISYRNARFRTVICLIVNNIELIFEGIVNGSITEERSGDRGFGYDPVFMPESEHRTFGEMPLDEKNKISHRAEAFNKFIRYIQDLQLDYYY